MFWNTMKNMYFDAQICEIFQVDLFYDYYESFDMHIEKG